jgi:hypothetical protein
LKNLSLKRAGGVAQGIGPEFKPSSPTPPQKSLTPDSFTRNFYKEFKLEITSVLYNIFQKMRGENTS